MHRSSVVAPFAIIFSVMQDDASDDDEEEGSDLGDGGDEAGGDGVAVSSPVGAIRLDDHEPA